LWGETLAKVCLLVLLPVTIIIKMLSQAKLEGENAPNVEGFQQAIVEISKLQQHISDLVSLGAFISKYYVFMI
jgi:hypothetical protein